MLFTLDELHLKYYILETQKGNNSLWGHDCDRQSDLKQTVETNLPCNLDPEDCSLYGQVLTVADLEHAGLHTVLGCLHVYLLWVLGVRTEMYITTKFHLIMSIWQFTICVAYTVPKEQSRSEAALNNL